MDKEQIIKEIELDMGESVSSGSCLYWADSTSRILRKHGYDAVIQAGSLQWPCRSKDWVDDGRSHTHFSYMWNLNEAKVNIQKGIMPEIHCWVGIRNINEIVDLSVRHLHIQYEKIIKEKWEVEIPPRYIWWNNETIPKGVRYIPDLTAIAFAFYALKEEFTNANR